MAHEISAPAWTKGADALLAWAEPRVRLLGSLTPLDLDRELADLAAGLSRGAPRLPAFRYPAPPAEDPRPLLERAVDELDALGPLGSLYAGRARELSVEAAMSRSAGTAGLAPLAAERYRARDAFHPAADRLAEGWLEEISDASDGEPTVASDDEAEPASLVSRLRAEIGRRRLPFRICVSDDLAALAATGPDVVYVGRGRRLTPADVERTVLHEIEGHALPRTRARGKLGIFARGTAFGSDDQEGRALLIEARQGRLDGRRRRELARRHLACRLMRGGADFVETARTLMQDASAPASDAVRIAARAHRGGGLGREAVYLPAFLRTQAFVASHPELEAVLAQGQIGLDAVAVLRPFAA
jgi:hypothetical protein